METPIVINRNTVQPFSDFLEIPGIGGPGSLTHGMPTPKRMPLDQANGPPARPSHKMVNALQGNPVVYFQL